MENKPRISLLIPCYNEESTVGKVVTDFHRALPEVSIHVYDNNSTDRTVECAVRAGAIMGRECLQGKGHVVRRMFADVEADWYIMVDGDDTYSASLAPEMLRTAMAGPYDLVNCVRRETGRDAYRGGHRFGNWMLTGVVRAIFGDRVQDMLSGYKVFSRRFVKSFPVLSGGFDIETELMVHALELNMPVAHIEGEYRSRPSGSTSKLRTYSDGWRILRLIIKLIRHERPILFFGTGAFLLALLSISLAVPIVVYFIQTGTVPRLPTAVLSTGLMLLAFLGVTTGIVLDTVTRGRKELRSLTYLQHPAPPVIHDKDFEPGRDLSGRP